MANIATHIANVEDALDAMAADPDVTSEEYVEALQELGSRCEKSASAHWAETHLGARP